jgi:hypothetical protein
VAVIITEDDLTEVASFGTVIISRPQEVKVRLTVFNLQYHITFRTEYRIGAKQLSEITSRLKKLKKVRLPKNGLQRR